MEGLANELVVLAVGADPEPMDSSRHWEAECSIVQTNPHAVKTTIAYGLELQRRVRGIGLQLCVAFVRKSLNICGERFQAPPKAL